MAASEATAHENHDIHGGHVVPLWLLVVVFIALLIGTLLTVAVTQYDLGPRGNLALALSIAFVKASLVVLYFMHLRWDRPVNAIVFICALFFVAIFCAATLFDSAYYERNVDEYRATHPSAPAIEQIMSQRAASGE